MKHRSRGRKILLALALAMPALLLAVGAIVGAQTGLTYWQGRGDLRLVPHATSVLKVGDDDVHRRLARFPLDAENSYIARGRGFDSHSWARWQQPESLVTLDVAFHRLESTALRSGTDAAVENMRESRRHSATYVKVTTVDGLGDEASR